MSRMANLSFLAFAAAVMMVSGQGPGIQRPDVIALPFGSASGSGSGSLIFPPISFGSGSFINIVGIGSGSFIGSGNGPSCEPLLEAARGCNLWVRGDATLGTGTVEGKVCVGGSMSTPGGFTMATNLDLEGPCAEDEHSLVVAGDLTFATGTKGTGAHCIGGSLLGDVNPWGPLRSPGCAHDSVEDENQCRHVIDFEADYLSLAGLSDSLAAGRDDFAASTAEEQGGVITITVDASYSRHIVELDSALFERASVWGLDIDISGGSADDIEIIVVNLVNVPDYGLEITKYFAFSDDLTSKVLFNYAGSYSISQMWSVFKGSLLAPRATFVVGNSPPNMKGQLIVGSFQVTSTWASMSLGNDPLQSVMADGIGASARDITVQLDNRGRVSITSEDVDDGSYAACGILFMTVSPRHFDCSDAQDGPVQVTLTVSDYSGRIATDTAYVTVQDTSAPLVFPQNTRVPLDVSGVAAIEPADVERGSLDNCYIVSKTAEPSAFTCADVGNVDVTLTVVDASGNSADAIAIAVVEDIHRPVVVTKDITVQLDAAGAASITPEDVDDGSSDACGIQSMRVSPNRFSCSDVGGGPVAVTLTVTDVNGNIATNTAYVTVEDNIAPVAIAKDISVAVDRDGAASITGSDVDDGSTDACGIADLSVDPASFTCADIGEPVAVTLTVTDNNGNTADVDAEVTVQDLIRPEITCQDANVYLSSEGTATVTAADVVYDSSDNCGIDGAATVSPSQFSMSNIGSNMVTVMVVDVNGNAATCTANVTVIGGCAADFLCPGECMHTNEGDMSCVPLSECIIDPVTGMCDDTTATFEDRNRNIPCDDTLCYCPAGSEWCPDAAPTGLRVADEAPAEQSLGAQSAQATRLNGQAADESGSSGSEFTWVVASLVGVIVVLSVALLMKMRAPHNNATRSAVVAETQDPVSDMFAEMHGKVAHKSSPTSLMGKQLSAKLQFDDSAAGAAPPSPAGSAHGVALC